MIENYTPHGEIEIIDVETGEVVQKTHNMIVESGRDLILRAVFNGEALKADNFKKFYEVANNLNDSSLKGENVLTTPEMTYDKIKNRVNVLVNGNVTVSTSGDANIKSDSARGIFAEEPNINHTTYDYTYTDTIQKPSSTNHTMAMHFHLKIENANIVGKPIIALGLLYETSTKDYKLFSRAVVDPVYIRDDKVYMVNYSIYF